MGKILVSTALFFYALSAFAAIDRNAVKKSQDLYIEQGMITGGEARTAFSLLDLRRTASKKDHLERIVMDVGDVSGHPLKGQPGYFHADVAENPPRMTLSIAQTSYTMFDQSVLQKQFKDSLYVKKSKMSIDAQDRTVNITLFFKKAVGVKVYPVLGAEKPSRIVVDLAANEKSSNKTKK